MFHSFAVSNENAFNCRVQLRFLLANDCSQQNDFRMKTKIKNSTFRFQSCLIDFSIEPQYLQEHNKIEFNF